MKLLNLNFTTLILRFYLLMAIVIGSFFLGFPLFSLLALPLFAVSLLGITFERKKRVTRVQEVTRTSKVQVGTHQVSH